MGQVMVQESCLMNKKIYTIIGNPISQQRHRMGRGYSYDPNANDKKRVRLELLLKHNKVINIGSVNMFVTFYMKRPKSHYRSGKFADMLKKDAPIFHIKKTDIDNLLNFIMDCCNGIIYKDDSQVNYLSASKIYAAKDEDPRTEITFSFIKENKNNDI